MAARGGDQDAAVARAQVDDVIVGPDLGHRQHRVDHLVVGGDVGRVELRTRADELGRIERVLAGLVTAEMAHRHDRQQDRQHDPRTRQHGAQEGS